MCQRENDCERTIEKELEGMLCQMHVLQQRVEDAVAAEDRLPRVRPHQVAHPQRNDDELVEEILFGACIKGKEVCQWITQQ